MAICCGCQETDDSKFKKSIVNGKTGYCRKCDAESKRRLNKNPIGLSYEMYKHQKNRKTYGRGRGEPPTYTLSEFRDWLFSRDEWEGLYNEWVASGYDKKKYPSVDRIDSAKGYTIDNIQLMPFQENMNKKFYDIIDNPISTNKTGATGVYFDKTRKKYRATIVIENKNIHIKYCDTVEEAIVARTEYVAKNIPDKKKK